MSSKQKHSATGASSLEGHSYSAKDAAMYEFLEPLVNVASYYRRAVFFEIRSKRQNEWSVHSLRI